MLLPLLLLLLGFAPARVDQIRGLSGRFHERVWSRCRYYMSLCILHLVVVIFDTILQAIYPTKIL